MNSTPTAAGPSGSKALVITKPGYDAIRIGALTPRTAEDWAAALRSRLHQAPAGTVIEVIPHDPAAGPYIGPDSIPRTVEDLAGQMRADPGHPDNGGFPDLLDRLMLVHGEPRANAMWTGACHRIDDEIAYEQASQAAAAARADAAGLISPAHALLQHAGQKLLHQPAAGAWGFDAMPGGDSDDAQHHIDTAARELRAAGRALGATGQEAR
jgi:hypothetical protein